MAPKHTHPIARFGLALRVSALIALTLVSTTSAAVNAVRAQRAAAPAVLQLQAGEFATQLSDGSLLVSGGVTTSGQPTGDAYVLTAGRRLPLTNRFQEARTGHTATVMPDGKVLVHGGTVAGGGFARRTEMINPQTRTVSSVSSLDLVPRAHHTTSILADGTVVVAGGVGPDGFPLFDVELFNGFTYQQHPARSSLLAARHRHTALLIESGQLVISGGQDRIGPVATGEALDPSTNEFAPITTAQLSALQSQAAQRAPARLAGSIPLNDASGVETNASVSLRFSNSVSVVGSQDARISLRTAAGTVPVATTITEQGRLLFINPQRPLAGGEVHTLAVEGLIDDNGAALARIELKFTTAGAATGSSPEVSTGTSKPPSSAPTSPPTSASSAPSAAAASAGTARTPTKTDLSQIKKTVRLPLFFEMNVGQSHPEVKARTLGAGLGVFLTSRSVVFKLPHDRRARSDQTTRAVAMRAAARGGTRASSAADVEPAPPAPDVLRMNFVGGKPDPTVLPEQPLPGKTHYLRTDGRAQHRNIAHYGRIRYLDVYPGIDKVHYGVEGKLEHDWIVKPGADPAQIVAEFEGATGIELQPSGDMVVRSPNSSLTVRKPYAYQVVAGKRKEIAAAFKVVGTDRVTFALGSYDKTRELVIDPVVEYLSYLAIDSGSTPVLGMSAAADGSLFLLISSQGGFPNRFDLAPTGGVAPEPNQHVFVVKLNSSGTAFDYATTIVGANFNFRGHGLAVDGGGRATFSTFASDTDCLPVDAELNGADRACGRLARLSADGSALDFFIRMPHGTGVDRLGYALVVNPRVAIGPSGDIFIVAPFMQDYFATPPPLPPLQAPIVTQTGGEGVVTGCGIHRFNPDGSGPAYSAYIRNCWRPSIGVDSANILHIAYCFYSTRTDAPAAPILTQRDGDDTWGRVARIDAAGTSFVYNTDLVADVVIPAPTVGRYTYTPYGAAIDAAGNFNVVGSLVSRVDPAGNLIASLDPFAVVAPASGCTYLPYPFGTPRPRFGSIHFGSSGAGYLVGTTVWPQTDDCNHRSGWIVKLAPVANQFQIADVRHFGASLALYDFTDSTIDTTGSLYVSGYSFSTPPAVGIPPRNPLPGQPYYPSGAFLAKFAETPQLVTTPNPSIANTPVALRFEAPDPSWTGSVLFKRNGVPLSSAPINAGVASIVRSDFPVGTYTITADYAGDGTHAATTLTTQHVAQTNVFRTFVNLTSVPAFPDECQDITLRATIPSAAGTLTAPIIFRHEYRELGRVVPNASRIADLNIGRWPLPLGSWWFNAYYAGDALHSEGAIGSVGVQIQAQNNVATLTQPLNDARFGFPSTVPITVAYTHGCLAPQTVRLFANNVMVREVPGTASPINFDWTPAFEGAFVVRATLIMPNGRQASTANVTVRVINGNYSNVETTFLHTDAAGSPVAATDAAGARIWTQEYDPFGIRVNPLPTATNTRQWFHGKAVDTESGLQYFGARYYDPLIGRFMGIDAAGVKDDNIHSFNRYAFANNNPYRFTDPDGNSPVDLIFLAVDVAKLGVAIYQGDGAKSAAVDVGLSLLGVISPVPGTGQVLKAARTVDRVSDGVRAAERAAVTMPHREFGKQGLSEGHHVIQHAAVKEIPGYSYSAAPAIHLLGPAATKGTPHNLTRSVQQQVGGGTYGAERRIGYKAMRRAGVKEDDARQAIKEADSYFGALGVTKDTPTRIPRDRSRNE